MGDFALPPFARGWYSAHFRVPGDYNLGLMQQLEDRGEPAWIGNCNES